MIHYKLCSAHIFILPISRDREQKKKNPQTFHCGHKQIGLVSFVGMETATQVAQAHSYLRSSCRIARASVKKQGGSNFLYKAAHKWNPSQNALDLPAKESFPWCLRGSEGQTGEKACPKTSASSSQSDFLIKHFPYQRMHLPVSAPSEERNSQQKKCWWHKREIFLQLLRNKMQ